MEPKKLTIKDSALSFLSSFLLCQLGVIFATILTLIFYRFTNSDTDSFTSFLNSAVGYLITALALYVVMLLVFFFFNRKKDNKITQPIKLKKLAFYILIAITSFFTLYPIVICFDSLLVKCGISLSSLTYELTTKNYFISLISLVIAPAICEELLFRGLIFKGLSNHGKIFSISITALMFCLFHMSISQTIYPMLMGLLLSVIMFYEQNIYYCIAVHMTNNFLSLTLSYFKINLIFNHWSYIVLAIILFLAFLFIVLMFTIKNNKKIESIKPTKVEKIYLFTTLGIMLFFWIAVNFI
ncbi:MAG: CPBP family intramembrane metalloprotease [Clostridia bacterium]|nr:CPBP family intramembrane metalloprotease [Clostridia bacterium]